jgi:hypothetical protein
MRQVDRDVLPLRVALQHASRENSRPPINMRSFLGAVSSSRILVTAGMFISIVSSVTAIPPAALQL